MYCDKKILFICDVFLSVGIGWRMTQRMQSIVYLCHKLNVMKHFVTVIKQKPALAIWGMKDMLCSM